MAFQKGDVYECPDKDCGCELTVTKSANPNCGGNRPPTCCCGKEMVKEDQITGGRQKGSFLGDSFCRTTRFLIRFTMKHLELDKPHKFFFETLGNQARWDIIHLLLNRPYRATDIADKLGYEQSLISHHLKRLETCGFVKVETNGTERIYHINKETIEPLFRLVEKHVDKFCKRACNKCKPR